MKIPKLSDDQLEFFMNNPMQAYMITNDYSWQTLRNNFSVISVH